MVALGFHSRIALGGTGFSMCTEQIEEIKQRLTELDLEEKKIPAWDGDAHDQIWQARQMFSGILKTAYVRK